MKKCSSTFRTKFNRPVTLFDCKIYEGKAKRIRFWFTFRIVPHRPNWVSFQWVTQLTFLIIVFGPLTISERKFSHNPSNNPFCEWRCIFPLSLSLSLNFPSLLFVAVFHEWLPELLTFPPFCNAFSTEKRRKDRQFRKVEGLLLRRFSLGVLTVE